MSISFKQFPSIVNLSSNFNKRTKKNFNKKKQTQTYSENKENISINIPQNKLEEEDNSSSKQLKTKKEEKKEIKEIKIKESIIKEEIYISEKSISNYQKAYNNYTEKMKERTLRIEVEKIYNETERLKQKYEEKNSFLQKFDNNPQFQRMLKNITKQILYFLIESIFINMFNEIMYYKVTRGKDGITLVCCCLSIALFATTIILLSSVKLGVLNDPDLSRAFRFFAIVEFILLVSSFGFSVVSVFFSIKYIKKIEIALKIINYAVFFITVIFFIPSINYCITLFNESLFILFGKKTEYSILMINEIKTNNLNNNEASLSTSMTDDGLNKTNSDLLSDSNIFNINKKEINNNDDEKFRNYNYFQKFHYSVSSERKKDDKLKNYKNIFKKI